MHPTHTPEAPLAEATPHRGAAAVAKGVLPEEELLMAAQLRHQQNWTEVKLRLNRNYFF